MNDGLVWKGWTNFMDFSPWISDSLCGFASKWRGSTSLFDGHLKHPWGLEALYGSMMIQTAKEKTSIVRTIFFQNCTYKEWIQLFTQLSHAFPRSKWGIAPKKVPCSYRQLGCTRGWSAKRTTLAASIKDTWLAGGWCVRKTCGFLACWRICCPQILWSRSPAICVVNYTA